MHHVLQNVSAISATNGSCVGSNYNPASGDVRFVRLEVTPSATGVPILMSPDMTLSSIPNALVSESVQGLDRSKLLEIGTGVHPNSSQANFTNLINGSDVGMIICRRRHNAVDYILVRRRRRGGQWGSGRVRVSRVKQLSS